MLPRQSKLNPKTIKFLHHFRGTLYTFIHDSNPEKPVITTEIFDLDRQNEGYGVFFSVNGFTGGKRQMANLACINSFFCDVDYPDKVNRTPEKVQEYKSALIADLMAQGSLLPTAIVETKNGLHAYWILKHPIMLADLTPDQQKQLTLGYREVEEAILKRFDGDPGAKDVARVLRVPQSLHQKDPKDVFECKLIHYNEEILYEFGEVRQYFMAKPPSDQWAEAMSENAINPEVKKAIEKEYPKLTRPSYMKLLDPATQLPEGMRNKALLVLAHACKEAGWSLEESMQKLAGFHGLPMYECRKTIRSAYYHDYDFGYSNEIMNALAEPEERKQLSEVTSKVLSKATEHTRAASNNQQKEMYLTYEHIISQRFPNLKYKHRGDFYDYKDGVYKPMLLSEVQSLMIREMLGDGLTNYRKLSAVNDKIACFKSLDNRTFRHEDENPDPNILNFKNGLLNIETYALREHTPAYLSTNQIPVIYSADAKCPQWDKFVEEISDGDVEQQILLQQIAGYCLTNDTSFAKAFIFFGSGANGKSLFTRIITKIIGRDAVSNIPLSTITKQFGLTGLVGKKLNIIDEISGNYFESNVIKGLISGERMSAEVKFRPEPLEFTPIVKIIFSVNELPKINDTTPGLYRRFIIVPFERSFFTNPDLALEAKLTTELTGILNWAIEGLKMLRKQGYFTESKKNQDAMSMFKTENSPLLEFLQMSYMPVPPEDARKYGQPAKEVYMQYRQYCFDSGYKPKAISNFLKEIVHTNFSGWKLSRGYEGPFVMLYGIKKSVSETGAEIVWPEIQQRHVPGE